MKEKIGMITIGQSPRIDIVPEMKGILGPEIEVLEAGTLDGLSSEEIQDMAPSSGDYILVTLLRNGTPVTIGKRHILLRMQNCINDLTKKGAELIILLCTGEFPEFVSKKITLRPDRLVNGIVRGLLTEGTLGVVVPLLEQIPQQGPKWAAPDLKVIIENATPYGTNEEITRVAEKLAGHSVDLIALDCIGYNLEMKETIREITGKPVILARSILARAANELIG